MLKMISSDIYGKNPAVKELQEIIQCSLSEIEEPLIGDLSYFSENARYEPNSLQIVSITQTYKNQYSMSYRYKWTIFNGCLDINADEFTTQNVTFMVKPEGLEFDIIDTSRGTTADEL